MNFNISIVFTFLLISLNNVSANCGCSVDRKTATSTNFKSKFIFEDYFSKDVCFISNHQYQNMSFIAAGEHEIGTTKKYIVADKESSLRNITLKSFFIDKYEVTNRQFHEFVKSTSYITEAERFGDSFVFGLFLDEEVLKQYEDFRVVGSPWWYKIPLTNWLHPEGNGSNLNLPDRWNHPVVHVSWNDAIAYCSWRNGRLPTEWEWEVACKGKKRDKLYPWGNKLVPQGRHRMNVWQGQFPVYNTQEDGWIGTSPVGTYPPNDYGLFDITGNVWEWTSSSWDINHPNSDERVKRGGSYLCHESYCNRYRCSARSQNTADSTASNLGFRCCMDPQ